MCDCDAYDIFIHLFLAVMSHFCKPKKNMNFINFVKVVFMVCQHEESTRLTTTRFNRTARVSFLDPIRTRRKNGTPDV